MSKSITWKLWLLVAIIFLVSSIKQLADRNFISSAVDIFATFIYVFLSIDNYRKRKS